jgi:hypothetical protein
LTAATAIPYASLDASRAELARRCREICLALETSGAGAASSLENDLSQALTAVRETFGADSVHEEDLLDLFRAEQTRVTDASILAELLAPRLTAWLEAHKSPSTPVPASTNSPRHETAPSFTAPAPRPLSASSPLPAPAGPPGIADLLDGMLEQDRQDERNRRTGQRR